MKKKALSYLLCAAMVFSMAACGDNADDQQESSPEVSDEQPSDEQPADDVEQPADDVEQPADDVEQPADEQPGEEEPVVAGPVAIRVEAEDFDGGDVEAEDGHLGGMKDAAWALYNVDLADGGYSQVAIRYGADSIGGTVTLYWGDEDYKDFGEVLGTVDFSGTGSWDMDATVIFDAPGLGKYDGVQNLVVEWKSPEGESDYLMNPDWIEFYKVSNAGDKTVSWNFFDNDFSGNENAGLRGENGTTHIYIGGGCNVAYKLNFGDEGGYNALALLGDFVGDCEMELHLESADGPLVGSTSFNIASDWNDAIIQRNVHAVSVPDVESVTGNQNVYLVVKGGDCNLAGFYFFVDNGQPFTKVSERVEAESRLLGTTSADEGSAGDPITDNNGNIGGTKEGTYNIYRLDFEDGGYSKLVVRYGTWGQNDGTMDIRYGSPDGELIATVTIDCVNNVPADAPEGFSDGWTNWATYEIDVPELAGITGEQFICIVCHPRQNDGWLGNIDYFEFSK